MKTTLSYVWTYIEELENTELSGAQKLLVRRLKHQFFPAAPKQVKRPIEWVATVLPSKPLKPQYEYIYSDGKYLYGTDGLVLFKARSTLYKEGWLTRYGSRDWPVGISSPDYNHSIPNKAECDEIGALSLMIEVVSPRQSFYVYKNFNYDARSVLRAFNGFQDKSQVFVQPVNGTLVIKHLENVAVISPHSVREECSWN